MNLRNITFENLDHEPFVFVEKLGSRAKHIQLWTEYRGIKIYNRQLWIEFDREFTLNKETYSLDRIKWFENLVEIQKILKAMGK